MLCTSPNFTVTLFCFIYGFMALYPWQEHESCYAPTRFFIIETLSLFLMYRLISLIRDKTLGQYKVQLVLAIILNLFIPTMLLAATVQGLVFHILNVIESTQCEFIEKKAWMVWTLLGLLVVVDTTLVYMALERFKMINMIRDMRARQPEATFNQGEILEEYINTQLNLMFLSGNLYSEGNPSYLTSSDIEKLPKSIYSASSCDSSRQSFGDDCPICFQEFKEGEEVSTLPGCSHVFHCGCVDAWFKMSPLCPVCRGNVKELLPKDTMPVTVGNDQGITGDLEMNGNARVNLEFQLLVPR